MFFHLGKYGRHAGRRILGVEGYTTFKYHWIAFKGWSLLSSLKEGKVLILIPDAAFPLPSSRGTYPDEMHFRNTIIRSTET